MTGLILRMKRPLRLTNTHQQYIIHKIYKDARYGGKDERPVEVIKDIKTFLIQNKLIKWRLLQLF